MSKIWSALADYEAFYLHHIYILPYYLVILFKKMRQKCFKLVLASPKKFLITNESNTNISSSQYETLPNCVKTVSMLLHDHALICSLFFI